MPKTLLSVLHLQQQTEADCLPVCAQMVLNYLNLAAPYGKLVSLLDTKKFGTPFRNIKRVNLNLPNLITIICARLFKSNSVVFKFDLTYQDKGVFARKRPPRSAPGQ